MNSNVFICPPCGESVAQATKEGQNKNKALWPLLPRLTAVLPPQGREITTRGFTLIELLVVVLIIGILAAVAVPQYQKAVMRSRYATLKHLVKSITDAQEVFYLANGQYAGKFEMLDVQIPEPLTKNEDDNQYTFPWGLCRMVVREPTPSKPADAFVKCQNDLIHMGYQIYPTHAPANKTIGTVCVIHDVGIDSLQAQICKQETGKEENDSSGTGWIAWFY